MGKRKLTPTEQDRREERRRRFSKPAPCELSKLVSPKASAKTTAASQGGDALLRKIGGFFEGTSVHLEKPYLRLTGRPKPEDVRPVGVLAESFKMVKDRYKRDGNYVYACEQMKSIRQDLTVQQCQTREDALVLTIRVYEAHARLALENEDLGEFNQCLTTLKELYVKAREILKSEKAVGQATLRWTEFMGYGLLYSMYVGDKMGINCSTELLKSNEPHLCYCRAVIDAIQNRNYRLFFVLYRNYQPGMSVYLMDHLVPRVRASAFQALQKSIQPSIDLKYLRTALCFEHGRKNKDGDMRKFLHEKNAQLEYKITKSHKKYPIRVLTTTRR
mmetsp:Transcript_9462/g.15487  ORF Transcript_9462/g.15487 Transcript_9462/m.15487 type:complete len:331 (+) Transcript_9462:334-1326(+)